MPSFSLRTWATYKGNLEQAERILVRSETETLESLGKELRDSARNQIRRFTGEAARRIKYRVSGRGLNKLVEVYGELVQHFADQEGLPPGIFPPWEIGSRIYQYAEKKGHILTRQGESKRRPRRVSHVSSRRPASIRARLRAANASPSGTTHSSNYGSNKTGNSKPGKDPTQHRYRVKHQRDPNRTRQSGSRERAIRRLAFLIARSIFEHGVIANQWASKTLEENRAKIMDALTSAFIKAVDEIND